MSNGERGPKIDPEHVRKMLGAEKVDVVQVVAERNTFRNKSDRYEKALLHIRDVLGPACRDNKCDGCRWEMEEVTKAVREALEDVM